MSGGAPAAASATYSAYSHQITINSTGGECNSVGAWDQYQESCTLNTDVMDTKRAAGNSVIVAGRGKIYAVISV